MSIADSREAARPIRGQAITPRDFLGRCLRRPAAESRFEMVTVPAPSGGGVLVDRLLQPGGEGPGFLWDPPSGGKAAGLGIAALVRTSGGERLGQLRDEALTLLQSIQTNRFPACRPFPPALFGGLAFAEGGADTDPWGDFGDCAFSLPRWCYRVDGEEATLSLAFDRSAETDPDRILGEYDTILERLGMTGEAPAQGDAGDAVLRQMDEGRWSEMVGAIRDTILSGGMTKIVAARLSEAKLDRPIDVHHLLSRLDRAYPNCYRFAFRAGGSVFLGASPEMLARKKDLRIWTEALAGSIGSPRNGGEAERKGLAAELLASAKDRAEHAIVVDSIGRRLGPLCSTLTVPETPRVAEFRHVMHLHTPITAELRERSHMVDLISVLHPTPSVGGVPTDRAIEWIGRNEPDPRGWYAGPIGWFDADGNGEFAVALRCGLVRGDKAYIYAGAGIVRDSDPAMEYAETNIKQMALLRALGVRV